MTILARSRDRVLRASIGGQERLRRLLTEPDRGDIPGWVLVTLMTAGIVTVLWAVAEPLLKDLFKSAVNSVEGP